MSKRVVEGAKGARLLTFPVHLPFPFLSGLSGCSFAHPPPLLAGECVVALANWLDSLVEGKWMNLLPSLTADTHTHKGIYKKGEEVTCCYRERESIRPWWMLWHDSLTLYTLYRKLKHNSSFIFLLFYLHLISPPPSPPKSLITPKRANELWWESEGDDRSLFVEVSRHQWWIVGTLQTHAL